MKIDKAALLSCTTIAEAITTLTHSGTVLEHQNQGIRPSPLMERLTDELDKNTNSELIWIPSFVSASDFSSHTKIEGFQKFFSQLYDYAKNTPEYNDLKSDLNKLPPEFKQIFEEFFVAELFHKMKAKDFIDLCNHANKLNIQEKDLSLIIQNFWHKLPEFILKEKADFCFGLFNNYQNLSTFTSLTTKPT